jgi:phosphoribosylformylglycinamidine synthase
MAFAGGFGAEIDLSLVPRSDDCARDLELLFSESNSRYLLEVLPQDVERVLAALAGMPAAAVGETLSYQILRVKSARGRAGGGDTVLAEALEDLRRVWKEALAF